MAFHGKSIVRLLAHTRTIHRTTNGPIIFDRNSARFFSASSLCARKSAKTVPTLDGKTRKSEDGKNNHGSSESNFRKLLFGTGGGLILAATAVSLNENSDSESKNKAETFKPGKLSKKIDYLYRYLPEDVPDTKLSRKIEIANDTSTLGVRLYQYQTCPFCSKVRAFLDYYGLSYEVVEVNPVTRKQLEFSEVRKVPLVILQGEKNMLLSDSSLIISLLRSYTLSPNTSMEEIAGFYPLMKAEDEFGKDILYCENKYFVMLQDVGNSKQAIANNREEREWREWVDGHFVHIISPNVYRTYGEAIETFKWFEQIGNWDVNFPWWEKFLAVYVGATAMYFISRRLKKKWALKPDVRESMYDACRAWTKAVGPSRTFLGGDEPNLADLAMYGSLTSFEGTQTFKDILGNTKIGPWFYAVKQAVIEHRGSVEFQKALWKAGKR